MSNPFLDFINSNYNTGFRDFLDSLIKQACSCGLNGQYGLTTYVVNVNNTHELTQYNWDPKALVQDAVHDSSRAVDIQSWMTNAISKLQAFFGDSPDIDFEIIKQYFLISQFSEASVEINSIILPSSVDQAVTLEPLLRDGVCYAFDNGAKKDKCFADGVEYVTQSQIYDNGHTVVLTDKKKPYPSRPDIYVNVGTLTIVVMPNDIGGPPCCFVIFSHGRIASENVIGMQGFMSYFYCSHYLSGFEPIHVRTNHFLPMFYAFTEETLNANIRPVSENKYYNGGNIFSSSDGSVMPAHFAEIIKFIADRNQCAMSGHFHEMKGLVDSNGSIIYPPLLLVSGDRYSLQEIYRFLYTNDKVIPFAYYGSSRYERSFKRLEANVFEVQGVPSRCYFSIQPTGLSSSMSPEEMTLLKKYRDLKKTAESNLSEYEKIRSNLEMEVMLLNDISAKRTILSEESAKRAESILSSIHEKLNEQIIRRRMTEAIKLLTESYENWVTHESTETKISKIQRELEEEKLKIDSHNDFLKKYTEQIDKILETAEGTKISRTNRTDLTTSSPLPGEKWSFDFSTEIISINGENRLRDVDSGYIYSVGESIITLDEMRERSRALANGFYDQNGILVYPYAS